MMVKKLFFLIFLGVAAVLLFVSCGGFLLRGIAYPWYWYSFMGTSNIPEKYAERLEAGARFPQALDFYINSTPYYFDFKGYFDTTVFVNKLYRELRIIELVCEWEGKRVVLVSDTTVPLGEPSMSKNGWYLYGHRRFYVNFSKLFSGKKRGDIFPVTFTVRFSFDDEPEQSETMAYEVGVSKASPPNPFVIWH
jgi:hypothetical protein